MDFSKFEVLEGRVSAMLTKLTSVTDENERLTASLTETRLKLAEAQKDIETAEGIIRELEAERDVVGSKIDSILQQLE